VIGAGLPEKGAKGKSASVITLAEAESVTGAPRNSLVNDFVSAFASKNSEKALAAISAADAAGMDIKMFIALALEKMRFALLYKNSKDSTKGMTEHMSPEDAALLGGLTVTSAMLAALLRAYDETGKAYIQTLPLELAVLALSAPQI